MTTSAPPVAPTGIRLHSKSRVLEIAFTDDTRFLYPCEYLRVHAPPGAEPAGLPVHGKLRVGITNVERQGSAALLLDFDDGYSGSYSWETLHALGVQYERNWQAYLQALQAHGLSRGAAVAGGGVRDTVTIRLLYFIQLATLAGRDEEEVTLPATVTHVDSLLAWLGNRRPGWQAAFAPDQVQVTVNRQFAERYTPVEHGDEVALVPRAR